MDIQNQGVIRRRGSIVQCSEKVASQGLLVTSKLVSKKKEQSRRKDRKANSLTPMVLLPAIRHLICSALDPRTTFFYISNRKYILWSKLLQLKFEMYLSQKLGFFCRKVQVPKRTYMQIFTLHQASGV